MYLPNRIIYPLQPIILRPAIVKERAFEGRSGPRSRSIHQVEERDIGLVLVLVLEYHPGGCAKKICTLQSRRHYTMRHTILRRLSSGGLKNQQATLLCTQTMGRGRGTCLFKKEEIEETIMCVFLFFAIKNAVADYKAL